MPLRRIYFFFCQLIWLTQRISPHYKNSLSILLTPNICYYIQALGTAKNNLISPSPSACCFSCSLHFSISEGLGLLYPKCSASVVYGFGYFGPNLHCSSAEVKMALFKHTAQRDLQLWHPIQPRISSHFFSSSLFLSLSLPPQAYSWLTLLFQQKWSQIFFQQKQLLKQKGWRLAAHKAHYKNHNLSLALPLSLCRWSGL